MVRKKKKNRDYVAGVIAKELRGGFVPGKIPSIPTSKIGDAFTRIARDQASKLANEKMSLKDIQKYMKDFRMPTALEMTKGATRVAMGLMEDRNTGYTNINGWKVPFKETDTARRMLGRTSNYSQKKYFTKHECGKPASRAITQYGRLNGTVDREIINTMFDSSYNAGDVARSRLSFSAGFNQRGSVVLKSLHHTVDDIYTAYSLQNMEFAQNKIQRAYGLTKYLWKHLKLMNTGSFFKTKVRIKMYSPLSQNVPATRAIEAAFPTVTEFTNDTNGDYIPLKYAFEGYTNGNEVAFARHDKAVSMTDSTDFARRFLFVRSFEKILEPGEVWDFKYKYHTGSGMRLDLVKDTREVGSVTNSLIDYLFVIEHEGVLCEGVDLGSTDSSFIGTSPSYVQAEFSKGYCAVIKSSDSGEYDSNADIGGVETTDLAVRAFSDDHQGGRLNRRYNQPPENIKNKGGTAPGVFIPVLTDTQIDYAAPQDQQEPAA